MTLKDTIHALATQTVNYKNFPIQILMASGIKEMWRILTIRIEFTMAYQRSGRMVTLGRIPKTAIGRQCLSIRPPFKPMDFTVIGDGLTVTAQTQQAECLDPLAWAGAAFSAAVVK